MKHLLFSLVSIIFIFNSLFSQNVAKKEINSVDKVKFTNYSGPVNVREPLKDIRNIGSYLSKEVKKSDDLTSNYAGKYKLIQVKSESDKFSADMILLTKSAKVKNIKVLRHIIAAYLVEQYNIDTDEAMTVSLFLSYYNAVYRGDVNYFSSKYDKNVIEKLDSDKLGLSTQYFDWPGKTQIVIPITVGLNGDDKDSKVDPFAISDPKVREEIRKDEDNLGANKDMLKIKEKEFDKRKDNLKDAQTDIDKKKADLEKEKKEFEDKKDEMTPEEAAKKEKELKDKEKDLTKGEDKIQAAKNELLSNEKDLEKHKNEILKEENKLLEKKVLETEKLTKKLKDKEKALEKLEDKIKSKKRDKNMFGNYLYYLKVKDYMEQGHYNNEMLMIHAKTGKVKFKSELSNICGRRCDVFADGVVVITHKDIHEREHYLALLDRKTLKLKKTGTVNIFWRSFIEVRDGKIYAIIEEEGKFFLGMFDKNLELIARSNVRTNENTFISFMGDNIYVNSNDNQTIEVLNAKDLKSINTIDPDKSN